MPESTAVQQNSWQSQETRSNGNEKLANFLGWFSVGLGLAELLAPDMVASMIGIKDEEKNRSLLRFYGVRELAAGVGILTQPKPEGWVWSRVAGDMLDLSSLGSALSSPENDKTKLTAATAAVLGITALDVYCGQQMRRESSSEDGSDSSMTHVKQSIIVNKSPEEVYQFWRNFENLPRFMDYLESVEVTGDRTSHWRAKGPGDMNVEWDAELTDDQPNSLISWRSMEGADVPNWGTVRFERATGNRGTVVHVDLEYAPPGGVISALVAKLFGKEPNQEVEHDLRNFKSILEIGEIAKSDASIHSGMHPAQPPEQVPANL